VLQVATERGGGRRAQGKDPGLAEFPLPDGQQVLRRVEISNVQRQYLPDPHACCPQQADECGGRSSAQSVKRGQPSRRFQDGQHLIGRDEPRWANAQPRRRRRRARRQGLDRRSVQQRIAQGLPYHADGIVPGSVTQPREALHVVQQLLAAQRWLRYVIS
jgi:hypothetical protein